LTPVQVGVIGVERVGAARVGRCQGKGAMGTTLVVWRTHSRSTRSRRTVPTQPSTWGFAVGSPGHGDSFAREDDVKAVRGLIAVED
jgi:hypothetical protein